MASSTPFDGSKFKPDAPTDIEPHGNDYQEHQATRKSMEFANNKEHSALAEDMSTTVGGGEHSSGSAKSFSADYSVALPQLRPSGSAMTADDEGRFAYDTVGTRLMIHNGGVAGTDADYTKVGGVLLDEDDMVSDSETHGATQQSIKKYADDGGERLVNGVATAVHTKYLTGPILVAPSTSINHEVTDGLNKILSVTAYAFNGDDSQFRMYSFGDTVTLNAAEYNVGWSASQVIFSSVGTEYQGERYVIKIDYID